MVITLEHSKIFLIVGKIKIAKKSVKQK